jgi:NAD+ diphosphatase
MENDAASWPSGVYSTLGFVESGETLEEAVFREVKEESGVEVRNICYFGSQPWPFPQSLMLATPAWPGKGSGQKFRFPTRRFGRN